MKCFVFWLFFATSLPTLAEGWYVGGGLGTSRIGDSTEGLSNDLGYKAFIGYEISPSFSLESGFARASKSGSIGYAFTQQSLSFNSDVKLLSNAFFAVGVFKIPISRAWAIFGKLGYSINQNELKLTINQNKISVSSERETQLIYGFGGEYALENSSWKIRADYDQFNQDVSLIGLNAVYHF